MSDHGIDAAIAERRHQPERIPHQIGEAERGEIAVVVRVPSGGAAITALVRRDHVIAGFRQHRHHLAPGIGEFGEAVQQQHAGPAGCLEAGFQHMHAEAVDVVDGAGADGGGERDLGEGGHCLRLSSPLPLWERVDRMSVSSFETGEGLSPRIETPHPPSLREGTFSHKGRREGSAHVVRRRVGKAQACPPQPSGDQMVETREDALLAMRI